ncbi:hypothetical protein [Thiomicrospira sp. ALE5]|uniref:hypothetical protein n=1 Tax=Thiomicrospira sp. ALE5 TaxID=748650 RepID=UPI001F3D8C78|nr:hypothetical protein [Thiomicrospira sp. ALE5]
MILWIVMVTMTSLVNAKERSWVLIVNKADVESLSATELARIYQMRQQVWPSGQTISVYRLPSGHPVHKTFVMEALKMPSEQLDQTWSRLIFSGRGSPPELVRTEEEMVRAVLSTPGAVGYARYELVRGMPSSFIRDLHD